MHSLASNCSLSRSPAAPSTAGDPLANEEIFTLVMVISGLNLITVPWGLWRGR